MFQDVIESWKPEKLIVTATSRKSYFISQPLLKKMFFILYTFRYIPFNSYYSKTFKYLPMLENV